MHYCNNITNIGNYAIQYVTTWGDLGLDARGIHRELKKFLAKRDTRIAEVSQLISNYGGEHLVDNDGLLKRDAATRQELDKWMRNSMICTWGNEPLPLMYEEHRAIKQVSEKQLGLFPSITGFRSRSEIIAMREQEINELTVYESEKEIYYENLWHSIRSDLGIYVAESFMDDFPEYQWDVVRLARKKNFMSYGRPVVVPKNPPKTGYYPKISLLHNQSAVWDLVQYRDGDKVMFIPNEIFRAKYATFFPVSGMYYLLEARLAGAPSWEKKKLILPSVPHSWVTAREELASYVRAANFDYSGHKNRDCYAIISAPKHLRENGETY